MSVSRKHTKSMVSPDLLIVTYSDSHSWTLCKASNKSQHLSPLEAIPHDHEKRKALMVEASKVADGLLYSIDEYTIEERRCYYPVEGINRHIVEVFEPDQVAVLGLVTFIIDTEKEKNDLIKLLKLDIDAQILDQLKSGVYNLNCDKFKNWLERKEINLK